MCRDHVYIHGPDGGWFGAGTLTNSYMVSASLIPGDHVENLYVLSLFFINFFSNFIGIMEVVREHSE
jgi:hypothetical protein